MEKLKLNENFDKETIEIITRITAIEILVTSLLKVLILNESDKAIKIEDVKVYCETVTDSMQSNGSTTMQIAGNKISSRIKNLISTVGN